MAFDLNTIGQGMERGAAIANKITAPVAYGMKTLGKQLVKVPGMIESKLPKANPVPGQALNSRIAGSNINNFISQQNKLKQAENGNF